jgi:hypothetical protein
MNTIPHSELLNYYATPGPFTNPGQFADFFDDLPAEVGELCQIVQNNLLHIFWSERYGRTLYEEEKDTVNVRPVMEKLALIQALDPRPLTSVRGLEQRQIGNCRDFTVMLTSILRHKGPAP